MTPYEILLLSTNANLALGYLQALCSSCAHVASLHRAAGALYVRLGQRQYELSKVKIATYLKLNSGRHFANPFPQTISPCNCPRRHITRLLPALAF